MHNIESINIDRDGDYLAITTEPVKHGDVLKATILNYSGEVIESIVLNIGLNKVRITSYSGKNYSIRIVNGKNVVVQKI